MEPDLWATFGWGKWNILVWTCLGIRTSRIELLWDGWSFLLDVVALVNSLGRDERWVWHPQGENKQGLRKRTTMGEKTSIGKRRNTDTSRPLQTLIIHRLLTRATCHLKVSWWRSTSQYTWKSRTLKGDEICMLKVLMSNARSFRNSHDDPFDVTFIWLWTRKFMVAFIIICRKASLDFVFFLRFTVKIHRWNRNFKSWLMCCHEHVICFLLATLERKDGKISKTGQISLLRFSI